MGVVWLIIVSINLAMTFLDTIHYIISMFLLTLTFVFKHNFAFY